MPGDFKPRGGNRGGRGGYTQGGGRGRGRGRGRGGFSKSNNYASKKRSSPDDDGEEAAPRTKRVKATTADGDETEIVSPVLKEDGEGNPYVAIKSNDLRRITVSDFNGSTLVSIREFWENDEGKILPGKKGISLSLNQYNTLVASLPLIESSLAKRGEKTVRPEYTGEPPVIADPEPEADEEEAEEAAPETKDTGSVSVIKTKDDATKDGNDWELDIPTGGGGDDELDYEE
ncbi:transcriptional Coactivator p15-domain-containing protein [Dendryphion nanum]|uniref:Transcriptional Coactivator p15-domain-containing protein n=1 Tax=Dendryphion nanum TaxID=256645 RepID=A0A9P9DGI3_9PLEO|nr:transcriptional Coactivator p15-domain-containing protein [Dendryphion nanum]